MINQLKNHEPQVGWVKHRADPPFLRWTLFLVITGYLLFAHGCHGDQDNELFARLGEICAAVLP
jgi:hypothetical protein